MVWLCWHNIMSLNVEGEGDCLQGVETKLCWEIPKRTEVEEVRELYKET
jgi:hypothetical protein